ERRFAAGHGGPDLRRRERGGEPDRAEGARWRLRGARQLRSGVGAARLRRAAAQVRRPRRRHRRGTGGFAMTGDTFLSWASVDADGRVTASCAYAGNSRIVPGGRTIASVRDAADYLVSWAPTGPGETVHVWLGGGVFVEPGATLDGLRPADAQAIAS